jgi:hypothetical protein
VIGHTPLGSKSTIYNFSCVETGVLRRDTDISGVLFCGETYLWCMFLRRDRLELFDRIQDALIKFSWFDSVYNDTGIFSRCNLSTWFLFLETFS